MIHRLKNKKFKMDLKLKKSQKNRSPKNKKKAKMIKR